MGIEQGINTVIVGSIDLLGFFLVLEKIANYRSKGGYPCRAASFLIIAFGSLTVNCAAGRKLYIIAAEMLIIVLIAMMNYRKCRLPSLFSYAIIFISIYELNILFSCIGVILAEWYDYIVLFRLLHFVWQVYFLSGLMTLLFIWLLSLAWKTHRTGNDDHILYLTVPLAPAVIMVGFWLRNSMDLGMPDYLNEGGAAEAAGNLQVCVMSMAVLAVGYLAGNVILDKKRYKELAIMNQKLLNAQVGHYDFLDQFNLEMRRYRHDFKNHLYSLKHLLAENKIVEAKQYVENMTDHIHEWEQKYSTGNDVADAMINEQVKAAQKQAIEFELTGGLPKKINISNYDLCVIFGNALANAVEGAAKTDDKRYVKVNLGYYNQYLHINIKNSAIYQKWRRTTKRDSKNHGFGLMNIYQCVEKLHGDVQIKRDKNEFMIDIVIMDM